MLLLLLPLSFHSLPRRVAPVPPRLFVDQEFPVAQREFGDSRRCLVADPLGQSLVPSEIPLRSPWATLEAIETVRDISVLSASMKSLGSRSRSEVDDDRYVCLCCQTLMRSVLY